MNLALVEDNPYDVKVLMRVVNENFPAWKVHHFSDGQEFLQFLFCESTKAVTPGEIDLVFLNLNMPKIKGHEVLEIIQNKKEDFEIPIVVVSTSVREQDKAKAYRLGASDYIPKPVDETKLMDWLGN